MSFFGLLPHTVTIYHRGTGSNTINERTGARTTTTTAGRAQSAEGRQQASGGAWVDADWKLWLPYGTGITEDDEVSIADRDGTALITRANVTYVDTDVAGAADHTVAYLTASKAGV